MINTTYDELFTLCYEQGIEDISKLANVLSYPVEDIVATLNRPTYHSLFKDVSIAKFNDSDWFNDDYEFIVGEEFCEADCFVIPTYITNYGSLLRKRTITKKGVEYTKYVEFEPDKAGLINRSLKDGRKRITLTALLKMYYP